MSNETDIVRRLSFGGVGNPVLPPELQALEDSLNDESITFLSSIQGVDRKVVQELREMQEYFGRLRSNYVELYCKKRFLELLPNQDQWQLEEKISQESHQTYKKVKQENSDLMNQIKVNSKQLADLYEKFEQKKIEVNNGLQLMKKDNFNSNKHNLSLAAGDSDDSTSSAKRVKTGEHSSNASGANEAPLSPHSAILVEDLRNKHAHLEKLQSELQSLSGVIQCQTGANNLQMILKQAGLRQNHQVIFEFFTESISLKSVKISPEDFIFDDILEYGVKKNDCSFILRELKNRLNITSLRFKEIEELRKYWSVSWDPKSMLLTVNYSNGVGVTIKMEAEYPKLYSRVEVIKFDHVLVKLNTKEMDKLQKRFNQGPRKQLMEIISEIEREVAPPTPAASVPVVTQSPMKEIQSKENESNIIQAN